MKIAAGVEFLENIRIIYMIYDWLHTFDHYKKKTVHILFKSTLNVAFIVVQIQSWHRAILVLIKQIPKFVGQGYTSATKMLDMNKSYPPDNYS